MLAHMRLHTSPREVGVDKRVPVEAFPSFEEPKIVCIVRSFAELGVRGGTQEHTEWDRFVAHGRCA